MLKIDQTKFLFGLQCLEGKQLLSISYAYAEKLQELNWPAELVIQTDHKLEGLVQWLGGILAQRVVVFDPGKKYEDMSAPDVIWHETTSAVAREVDISSSIIGFMTSGSTGQSKIAYKRFDHLHSEAKELRKLYELPEQSFILSLVSPFHIYGFLNTILLPLLTGASVGFARYNHGVHTLPEMQQQTCDLLISTPATWSLVQEIFSDHNIVTMVTSGAAFGLSRQQQAQALTCKPRKLIEVFGSTETGGIGYRDLMCPGDVFCFFPQVVAKSCDDGIELCSPFINTPQGLWSLDDDLELLENRCFRHLGRKDQVFKWAGQRYSLAMIEKQLQEILAQGVRVICRFDVDESPKGGCLLAAVEAKAESTVEVRARYQQRFSGPFPQRFIWKDRFERDENGKVDVLKVFS